MFIEADRQSYHLIVVCGLDGLGLFESGEKKAVSSVLTNILSKIFERGISISFRVRLAPNPKIRAD